MDALNAGEGISKEMALAIIASTHASRTMQKAPTGAVMQFSKVAAIADMAVQPGELRARLRTVIEAIAGEIDDRRRLLIAGPMELIAQLIGAPDWQGVPGCFKGDQLIKGSFAGVPVKLDDEAPLAFSIILAGKELVSVPSAGGVIRRIGDDADAVSIEIALPSLTRIEGRGEGGAGGAVPLFAIAGGGGAGIGERGPEAPAIARADDLAVIVMRRGDAARIARCAALELGPACEDDAGLRAIEEALTDDAERVVTSAAELMGTLVLTVRAAGGLVRIGEELLLDAPSWWLEKAVDQAHGGFILTAYKRDRVAGAALRVVDEDESERAGEERHQRGVEERGSFKS